MDQQHLLYSLLTLEDSLIFKLITKMGIPGEQFAGRVKRALERLPKVNGGQLYISNDLNKVLINAEDEAFQKMFEKARREFVRNGKVK